LVSNDDGFRAPGILRLADIAREFGEVLVCAPHDEQSGASHAISLRSSLRATPHGDGVFSVTGTPVDCVYLGALHLCSRLPDLVLAGINAGYNLGADVHFSGTVGAAREGRIRGASAMAVSVEAGADAGLAQPAVRRLIPHLLSRHRNGVRDLLNVNVPASIESGPADSIQITRLGERRYRDTVAERSDLQGRKYFWIGGPPAPADHRDGEDTYAVNNGRVAVTPLTLDVTAPSRDDWTALVHAREGDAGS
jgi:5'-nucleotidase